MADLMGALLYTLLLAVPLVAYLRATRRVGHTRAELVIAASLGGGTVGALMALAAMATGADLADSLPYALFGLAVGGTLGVSGVIARSIGGWLGRRP